MGRAEDEKTVVRSRRSGGRMMAMPLEIWTHGGAFPVQYQYCLARRPFRI